jgi:hypothetical protein
MVEYIDKELDFPESAVLNATPILIHNYPNMKFLQMKFKKNKKSKFSSY